MVYLRAVTPALCELLDDAAAAAAAAAPSKSTVPSVAAEVRSFIESRLRHLVHTQTPSQLDNALWVYLISQDQLLRRADASPSARAPASPMVLPASLQLPEGITTVHDAVQWYCGDLQKDEAESAAVDSRPPPPSRNSLFRESSSSSKSKKPQSAEVLLDELIRHRHQPTHTADTTTTTPPSPAADGLSASSSKTSTGPLATLQLALEALSNPKRAAALRQPRSLILVVRDFISLWSLVYLCKQLRRHQLRKEDMLKGTSITAGAVGGNAASLSGSAAAAARGGHHVEPIAVCFNDYDLLLPWDLVRATLRVSKGADPHSQDQRDPSDATALEESNSGKDVKERLSSEPVTMAMVAAQCRLVDQTHASAHQQHHLTSALPATSRGSISLVINPAVTVVEDNPDRLRKNARIDAIDEAANKYYYTLLATHAQGQTGLNGAAPAAAGGSGSTTAAASAAAHQEALRNSLATVDLGDYGVLDPSRMRAPVTLGSAGGSGGALSSSGSASGGSVSDSARSAKSYALFLRDASIGFDIRIMALTGAGVGYYMGYLRGRSTEWCTLYAVVGLVAMMLVDAVLIMIRMGRQDEAVLKARKRIRRQREKLEKEGEKLVQAMQQAAAGDGEGVAVERAASRAGAAEDETVEKTAMAPSAPETDIQTKKRQ